MVALSVELNQLVSGFRTGPYQRVGRSGSFSSTEVPLKRGSAAPCFRCHQELGDENVGVMYPSVPELESKGTRGVLGGFVET